MDKKISNGGRRAHPIDKFVGARIRQRRLVVGLSQTALGDRMGLTFQQIQKYEKGMSRVSAGRLFDLAGILGVPVTYFFEDATPPQAGISSDHDAPPNWARTQMTQREIDTLLRAVNRIEDATIRRLVVTLAIAISRMWDIPDHSAKRDEWVRES